MHVMAVCDIKSLLLCATTCKLLRDIVASELRTRSMSLFRLFFRDRARHFNGLLLLHNAIVSGSTALAFFAWPTSWKPRDLDVYVGDDAYDTFVADFETYFPITLDADMSTRWRGRYAGIKGVRRYVTSSGKYIEIIRSGKPNPAAPLWYFWSTVVVNFITPHAAVCAYPNLTAASEALVEYILPSGKAAAARTKYEGRGFTFSEVGSWRPNLFSQHDGLQRFVDGDLLVVDFRSVWTSDLRSLPIARASPGWVLKLPTPSGTSSNIPLGSSISCTEHPSRQSIPLFGYNANPVRVPRHISAVRPYRWNPVRYRYSRSNYSFELHAGSPTPLHEGTHFIDLWKAIPNDQISIGESCRTIFEIGRTAGLVH